MVKVIVVEDDFLFSSYLEEELQKYLNYKIISCVRSVSDANNSIKKEKPDVAIVDINLLGGGSGLDLGKLLQIENIPIVFITSSTNLELYEESLKISNQVYLVKPFHIHSLDSAIRILLSRNEVSINNDFLVYRNGGVKHLIQVKNIVYIESDGNYCTVITLTKKFLIKISLKKILSELGEEYLIRVHMKYIVNKSMILNVDFKNNIVEIKDNKLKLGRGFKNNVQKIFDKKL